MNDGMATAHDSWLTDQAAEPQPSSRRRQQASTRRPDLTGLPFERQRLRHFTAKRREEARDAVKLTYAKAQLTGRDEDWRAHRAAQERFTQLCYYQEKGQP